MLEGWLSQAMLLAGMALLALILLRRLQRRRGNKPAQPGRARPPRPAGSREGYSQPLADAPPQLARWHVEMHEVARELKAELDTKAMLVQTLIGMLREEVASLQRTLDEARIVAPSSRLDEIERLAQELSASHLSDAAAPAHRAQTAARGIAPDAALERFGQQVRELAAGGLGPAEIAARLHLPLGDVEFLLNVEPRR